MLLLASAVISVLMHQFDDAVSITVVRRNTYIFKLLDNHLKLGLAFILENELRRA